MAVIVTCGVPPARGYAPAVRSDGRALLRLLNLRRSELSISLTGDAAIQELNRRFRGKDKPTDVLSFPQLEDTSALVPCSSFLVPLLGDVVISIETAIRQARRLAIAPEARLRTLLIHGLLHLLGYDHEQSRSEARRMFARQRQLAAALDGIDNSRTPGEAARLS